MSSLDELPIKDLIKLLLEKAISAFEEGKQQNDVQPQKMQFYAWRIDDFQYSEKGATYSSAHGETFEKELWFKLLDSVKAYLNSLDIYLVLNSKIEKKVSNHEINDLDNFLQMALQKIATNEINQSDISQISESFEDYLDGKPIKCGAIIEFSGIAIEPDEINLNNGIILRQTKKEDVEKEELAITRDIHHFGHDMPSLIMEITMYGRHTIDVQHKISDAESILRLFKVGSIRQKSYEMFSNSFSSHFLGRISLLDKTHPAIIGYIKKSEIENLRKFWEALKERIPIFTRLSEHSSFRDIAYQRFQDSILKSPESVERRIADCMMGLEAIFLRDGGEQQELSYRLRLRTARLLGMLGHDPFKIKRMIRDGYNIRSRFVHGSTLDHDDVKELEDKYETMDKFLLKLLDILRISIVISLMVNFKKAKMIDLIDNSFLDKKNEEELRNVLNPAREVLKI